jgi:hypothetical protein
MSDADLDKIARRIQSRHHTTMMGEPVHDEDRMLAEIRRLRAALTPPPPRTKKGPPQGPLGCRWVTIIDLPSGEHLACVSIDGAQRYVDGQWRVETDPVVAVPPRRCASGRRKRRWRGRWQPPPSAPCPRSRSDERAPL